MNYVNHTVELCHNKDKEARGRREDGMPHWVWIVLTVFFFLCFLGGLVYVLLCVFFGAKRLSPLAKKIRAQISSQKPMSRNSFVPPLISCDWGVIMDEQATRIERIYYRRKKRKQRYEHTFRRWETQSLQSSSSVQKLESLSESTKQD